MKQSDQSIIEDIKSGGEEGLVTLYRDYRNEFVSWAGRNLSMDQDTAADIFQESIIGLRRNVMKGKLNFLTSSLKTYLFAIGKNLALSRLKKDSRMIADKELLSFRESEDFRADENVLKEDQVKFFTNILNQIGEPCLSILKLFYYQNFSMEAIALRLNYKNENVVKSQKLRCIKLIKSKISDQHLGYKI